MHMCVSMTPPYHHAAPFARRMHHQQVRPARRGKREQPQAPVAADRHAVGGARGVQRHRGQQLCPRVVRPCAVQGSCNKPAFACKLSTAAAACMLHRACILPSTCNRPADGWSSAAIVDVLT